MNSGSLGATAFRVSTSALATISWAARNADRPSGVSSVVKTPTMYRVGRSLDEAVPFECRYDGLHRLRCYECPPRQFRT